MKKPLLIGLGVFAISSSVCAEIPPHVQRQYDRRWEEMKIMDLNRDGLLQISELLKTLHSKFKRADLNGDEVLSPEEVQIVLQQFAINKEDIYGNTTERQVRKMGNRYHHADENEDTFLSSQEYNAYFGARYRSFDRNGDGVVSVKEYRMDTERLPAAYLNDIREQN